jgi:hypothetical protein
MSINAKATFYFRYKQAGYTFSLYNVCPSLEALTGGAKPKGSPIDNALQAYMQLLGSGVESPYVRVSDQAIAGDSLFYDRTYVTISTEDITSPGINTVQVKVITGDFPDFYDTAALVTLSASNTQKGRIFMRFIPDSLVQYPFGLVPDRNWDNAFKRFIAQLITDKWCLRCLVDANTNAPKPIIQVARPAANQEYLVNTFVNHGFNPNQTVRLSRVQGTNAPNGVYLVSTTPSATSFTLSGTAGTDLTIFTKGSARLRAFGYPAIVSGGYRYVTRRKAGRPFGTPVGRRKRIKTSH